MIELKGLTLRAPLSSPGRFRLSLAGLACSRINGSARAAAPRSSASTMMWCWRCA